MRCTHCDNTMSKTDEVVEQHTRQTWYECPVCSSVHTVSERAEWEGDGQRIGNAQRFSAGPTAKTYW